MLIGRHDHKKGFQQVKDFDNRFKINVRFRNKKGHPKEMAFRKAIKISH